MTIGELFKGCFFEAPYEIREYDGENVYTVDAGDEGSKPLPEFMNREITYISSYTDADRCAIICIEFNMAPSP